MSTYYTKEQIDALATEIGERVKDRTTGTYIVTQIGSEPNAHVLTDADKAKLDAVESGATDDQTGAEIKALYEAEADTNAFTDAEKAKLGAVEAGATGDMTGAEIKAAYEGEANTNAFTDAEKTKLAGLDGSKFLGTFIDTNALTMAHPAPAEGSYAHVDAGAASGVELHIWDASDNVYVNVGTSGSDTAATVKTKYESNADTNAFTDAEKAKLAAIEAGATGDMTGAEIKAAYEGEANTNAFTDADKAKLDAVESGATDDQTGAEIKALYEAEADTNAFTDAEKTKLAAIEAGATGDQTGAEIKALYEAEANTNAFTDAEKTKLSNLDFGDLTDTPAAYGAAGQVVAVNSGQTGLEYISIDSTQYEVIDHASGNILLDADDFSGKRVIRWSGNGAIFSNIQDGLVAASLAGPVRIMATGLNSEVRVQKGMFLGGLSGNLKAGGQAIIKGPGGYVDIYPTNTDDVYDVRGNFENATPRFIGMTTVAGPTALNSVEASAPQGSIGVYYPNGGSPELLVKSNTNNWVDLAGLDGATIKQRYEAEANTNAFTDAEKTKLAGLVGSKFLGTYTDVTALNTAHPSPAVGSYAHVDAGASNGVELHIWDNDDSAFVNVGATGAGSTAHDPLDLTSNLSLTNADVAGGRFYFANSATDLTVTVPTGLTTPQPVSFMQEGAGAVEIVASAGVTLIAASTSIKTRAQYSALTLIPTDVAETYLVVGDMVRNQEAGYLGTYSSLSNLTSTETAPPTGAHAFVDDGTGDTSLYIWDANDTTWVSVGASPSVIKTAYESNADTNAFTDALLSKLNNIAPNATEETAATVKTKYESNANTNAFTDSEKTKLAGLNSLAIADDLGTLGTPTILDFTGADWTITDAGSGRYEVEFTGGGGADPNPWTVQSVGSYNFVGELDFVRNNVIEIDSTSTRTCIIEGFTGANRSPLVFVQRGVGRIRFMPDISVTLYAPTREVAFDNNGLVYSAGQGSVVILYPLGGDNFALLGDVADLGKNLSVNVDYTLTERDFSTGANIFINSSANRTVTIPAGLQWGGTVNIYRQGLGQVSINGAAVNLINPYNITMSTTGDVVRITMADNNNNYFAHKLGA